MKYPNKTCIHIARLLARSWGVAAFALVMMAQLAQATEYVVFSIEGDVEDLALGQILSEGDRFEVPDNARVDLISKQGEIITLAGPARATVTREPDDETGEKAISAIASLLFEGNSFVQVTGGTRSVEDQKSVRKLLANPVANEIWEPILSASSTYCLKETSLVLRRDPAIERSDILFEGGVTLDWEPGEKEIDLKPGLTSVNPDNMFAVTVDGRRIVIVVAPDNQENIARQAAWMAERGCKLQALQLLASGISDKD